MNERTSLDPAGHIKLSTSNSKKSRSFYAVLFRKLGFKQVADYKTSAAWVTRVRFGIWVCQATILQPSYVFSAPGLHHVCFKAMTREDVDKIYAFLKHRTRIFEKPSDYPDYSPHYYAVFFADPDGIKLEVAYY